MDPSPLVVEGSMYGWKGGQWCNRRMRRSKADELNGKHTTWEDAK